MELTAFWPILVALALTALLTPLVRRIAIRAGMVAHPKNDRWHRRPTALLGGISIGVSVALTWLFFAHQLPHHAQGWTVLGGSLFLGMIGFVDDVVHIKPYQKLICQLFASALAIYAGLILPWTVSPQVNIAITFFWLVGITNAINLLDNMDGLAAGVSATAAVFLSINLALNNQPQEALMLAVLAGALVGFLIYNSNPASVFMGDTGSMFIGFFLASAALMSASGARSRSFLVVLAVPVLVLFIPIFDTTLVTIMRKLAGRPASQGGRDHTSHRLVALGLSESRAVWLLYGLAIASGMLAVAVNHLNWLTSVAAITAFVIALSLLGIYLGRVRVYDEAEFIAARQRPMIAFIVDMSYKRRVFEVLMDSCLVMLAFYTAETLVDGSLSPELQASPLSTVSVLVLAQMAAMLVSGAYRGIWRYVSIDNLLVYAKATVLGTLAAYLVSRFLVGGTFVRGSVFVIDGILFFVAVAASRAAFRLFRYLIPIRAIQNGRRAVIFGAGDGGEILLRELQNNRSLGLTPIAFIDDDALKAGRNIHGLPVHHATPGGIAAICKTLRADEVLVSTSKLTVDRLQEIVESCSEEGVVCRRMKMQLDVIAPSTLADSDAIARRHNFTIDSTPSGEIKRRRDSQPIAANDVVKRRDSKPFRAAH